MESMEKSRVCNPSERVSELPARDGRRITLHQYEMSNSVLTHILFERCYKSLVNRVLCSNQRIRLFLFSYSSRFFASENVRCARPCDVTSCSFMLLNEFYKFESTTRMQEPSNLFFHWENVDLVPGLFDFSPA